MYSKLQHKKCLNAGGPNGNYISPFHDIPLYANDEKSVLNMVVEIPRWTNSKMEINKEEKLNPIKQDVKKGNLRFVKNVFPHHGYIWNYGAFPQTWEDPNHVTKDTQAKGDCDPLDVCEIGHKIHKRGAVVQVKVLGTMCLIDEGETDWKIICIDVEDPLAKDLNDIGDVEKHMPGFLKATYEWFKIYKIPDGKPENQFAFDGESKNKDYAKKVIEECNKQWVALIGKTVECGAIACDNTTVAGSPFKIEADDAKKIVDGNPQAAEPKPIPEEGCTQMALRKAVTLPTENHTEGREQ
ncbi:hypothetical protein FSP39_013811 [Pinctada imbricata]|uniref:Inorganic pyrophosphatase n=1 Tax=Pinctada imbricata TaxID=66713 RepID=A0AA88Y0Z8_PINIB|nr:hypothetical protein FSP39_013811 [Pinctada imbricata]